MMVFSVLTLASVSILTRNEFSTIADQLYDNAFVGVHYAHKVEVKFVRFEVDHKDIPPPYRTQDDIDALQNILNDLDVAVERAPGAHQQALARAVRADINGLMDAKSGGSTSPSLPKIDKKLTHLVQSFADSALDMRTGVDDRVERSTQVFFAVIAVVLLFGIGGAVLLVINIAPPLRRIARMIETDEDASTVAAGRLLVRKDEIGAVARALDRWRKQLQESIATLEERVLQRTAELEGAKDEAEAANLAKTSFLANVSHEIRTPLNGVLGMAQAMDHDDLAPHQRERLDVIRQSGEALLHILNDVLDLSKIEAGKLELETIEFDLEALVESVQAPFGHLAAAKGLGFSLDAASAFGVYRGDPVRVRQVMYNLISNALKFTETGAIDIRLRPRAPGLRVVIQDSGIGMSPEVLSKLFSKFTQADASTTRRFGGTGLGLSICLQLVELMGGKISAESEVGVGSTFTVDLPIERVADPAASPAIADEDVQKVDETAIVELRVLAAEDNAVNQLVLKTLLGQAGIDPVMVANGREAVEAWRAGDFDLVLMDVQMPEMDGPTATREIRGLEASTGRPRTPVIALTANVMAHQIEQYRAAGMDGHIAKPIDVRELFATLSLILDAPGRDQSAA